MAGKGVSDILESRQGFNTNDASVAAGSDAEKVMTQFSSSFKPGTIVTQQNAQQVIDNPIIKAGEQIDADQALIEGYTKDIGGASPGALLVASISIDKAKDDAAAVGSAAKSIEDVTKKAIQQATA